MKLLTWRRVKTATAVIAMASMAITVGFMLSPMLALIPYIEWWTAWPVASGGCLQFTWRYGRLLERRKQEIEKGDALAKSRRSREITWQVRKEGKRKSYRCQERQRCDVLRPWEQAQQSKRNRRPGKPTDNTFIESFNGRFRQECLNENWFLSLEDAEEKVESWRRYYNGERPHSALGNLSAREFVALATTAD